MSMYRIVYEVAIIESTKKTLLNSLFITPNSFGMQTELFLYIFMFTPWFTDF